MASFNRVMLIGRLTRDPELRYTSSGLAVASFSIAVDRRSKNAQGEKVTDFFRCSAWRQSAEFVNEYARKGRLVAVDGRIEINEYNAQDGTRKQSVDIVVDNFQLLDRGDEGGAGGGGGREDGGGYYPDEEASERPARPQSRDGGGRGMDRGGDEDRPARPAARPAAAPARPAARAEAPARAARPAAKPAPEAMYPADDFDDSDPFADE